MGHANCVKIKDAGGADATLSTQELLYEILLELRKLSLMLGEGMNIEIETDELDQGDN